MPLIEVARAETEREALEGLERWKAKHPEATPHLEATDVMVDSMRGRSTSWTRIRVNLRHVPEDQRPSQEALEVDYDPWQGVEWSDEERAQRRRRHSGSAQDQSGGDSPS
jgi:bifunctional non-homologous end joining protein LigD